MNNEKRNTRKEESMNKAENNSNIYLLPDVEYLVIETDEDNPVTIAIIDNSNQPVKLSDGYRLRAKFKER